jgi:transglutaminase-like putative cysteine protease
MKIQVGYEMIYGFPQATPVVLMVNVHPSRANDLEVPDQLITEPAVPVHQYFDSFGNLCTRLVAPAGTIKLQCYGVVHDDGHADPVIKDAIQHPVNELPDETLQFLLASRYCETELLSQTAWNLFGNTKPGWTRVQAICDWVNNHIKFSYPNARCTRTAWEGYSEQSGVCRDFTHLAVAFCRCMNIPARYCTGYLSDIDVPPPYTPMDFAAWFEAYIGGAWHMFDPRNNVPRKGRIVMAKGRDAADVAIATTFGPHWLESFKVYTDEIKTSASASQI